MTKRLKLSAATLGIGLMACTAMADLDLLTFDTTVEGTFDDGGWPGNTKTLTWTNVNAGGPAGGSLYLDIDYPIETTGWQDSKVRLTTPGENDFSWPGIDIRPYAAIEMDLKVDVANSALTTGNNYGGIELVMQGWEGANGNPAGLGWVKVGSATIQNTNDWQKIRIPVTSFQYNANRIILNFNVNPAPGSMAYFVDNIRLISPPPVPPALKITKAPSGGLQLIASQEGDQWQRQNIYTMMPIESWHAATAPIKIELDIDETAGDGWQSHIYVAPSTALPYGAGDGAPDWNATNIIFIQFSGNTARFMYKTNQGSGNSMFWNDNPDNGPVGTLAILSGSSATGTFSVTFTNPNEISMTVPGGAVTNFTIPSDVSEMFRDNLYVYFGIQANNLANVGKYSVFGGARISGNAIPVNETFAGPQLDPSIWGKSGVNPDAILINGAEGEWQVSWQLPASSDAGLAVASSVTGPWTDLNLPGMLLGSTRQVTVPASKLPPGAMGFFALRMREATKLQLLLPGENNDPTSPTGKSGTPTYPVWPGEQFQVRVLAVDDNWNRVSTLTDTIKLTTTDTMALVPEDAAMTSGLATMNITMVQGGTWTITATDVTDPTKTAATATVTINQ